jgi:hypothetical protein
LLGNAFDALADGRGELTVLLGDIGLNGIGRAFPDLVSIEIHTAHSSLRAEWNKGRTQFLNIPFPQPVLFFCQDYDAASFRCLIGEGGKLRGICQFLGLNSLGRKKRRRLAIAERDRTGLVEKQHVHVTCGFDRAARHGNDVRLYHPVHPRDANGREQPADGRWNETDQERDEDRHRNWCSLAGGIHAV